MDSLKPALELTGQKIEPGDTTHIPINIPATAPVVEASIEDQTPQYQQAREANVAAHLEGQQKPVETHRVYKSTIDTSYIFKDGSIAVFRNKRYLTNNPMEIAEFDHEIKIKKNQFFWIDSAEETADPALEDPIEKLKAKMFTEWAEQVMRAINPTQDAGRTVNGPLNVTNSANIAPVAQGGAPLSGVSAQMQNLLARIKGGQ